MARVVNLSPYHFAQEFRLATRLTLYQFVIARRVEQAQHLPWAGGELGLAEVAFRGGWANADRTAHGTGRPGCDIVWHGEAHMNLLDEVGVGGLDGLSQLRALIASRRKPGILIALDFEFVEVEAGIAVFAGTPGEHAYNPLGTVHGGYAATLLDSACGCAVHSRLTASQAYTTLELKVAYHKPITKASGPLRAEGRVLSIGRRAAFAEAKLTGANGRLYASATSTLLVFDR